MQNFLVILNVSYFSQSEEQIKNHQTIRIENYTIQILQHCCGFFDLFLLSTFYAYIFHITLLSNKEHDNQVLFEITISPCKEFIIVFVDSYENSPEALCITTVFNINKKLVLRLWERNIYCTF